MGAQKKHFAGLLGKLFDYTDWRKACNNVNKFADTLVTNSSVQHRKRAANEFGVHEADTLLEAFIQGFDDPIDVRNEILQFFMAAPQTVPSVLTFVVLALSQHPEVWTKLRAEVLEHGTASLSCETVKSMPYMRKVMLESNTPFLPPSILQTCRIPISC